MLLISSDLEDENKELADRHLEADFNVTFLLQEREHLEECTWKITLESKIDVDFVQKGYKQDTKLLTFSEIFPEKTHHHEIMFYIAVV